MQPSSILETGKSLFGITAWNKFNGCGKAELYVSFLYKKSYKEIVRFF